jgi:hypothetical protein
MYPEQYCLSTCQTQSTFQLSGHKIYGNKSQKNKRIKDEIKFLYISTQNTNILKHTGNFTYHKVYHSKIPHCDHVEFVCFVWISEQTANFALRSIKILVFITEVVSVYCAVRTESSYKTHVSSLKG